jgi:nucleolar complex protein 2
MHLQELSKLAEKDPEFYKYLQENDKELLKFDPHATELLSEEDEGNIDQDAEMVDKIPVLTQGLLRTWQKALLEARAEFSLVWHLNGYSYISNVHYELFGSF